MKIYSTDISPDLISSHRHGPRQREGVAEPAAGAVYPILYLDALIVKIRDGNVETTRATWRWAST